MTPKQLESHVKSMAKSADTKALKAALGALVNKRLAKPKPVVNVDFAFTPSRTVISRAAPKARSSRKRGRIQAYTPTGKANYARWGTWRHHMIDVVCKHHDTLSAEEENAQSDFAKNRLDFSWCAANGYIDFV
jgi:hypothetical protein